MATAPPLLQLSDIALTFGGTPLLEGAELAVAPGERVCLVGRNGSGKSTLLRIAAGLIEPDRGERFMQPGASVRYLPQEPDLAGHATTLAYVESGLGPTDDPHQARYLLQQLGLSGDEDPASLSGGELRRAALAHVLAPAPDILLLDEPTNHLDLPAIEWLEARLAAQRGALVLISHDRRFLENLSQTTVWLDRGRTRRIDIGFRDFEAWRDEQLAEEEVAQHKLDRKIVREEHWVRYGVTARRKRNMRRMGELQALREARRDVSAARPAPRRWRPARRTCPASWWSRPRASPRLRRPARSSPTSPIASCAATGSASSAPTAAARPRWSACSPARSPPTAARCGSAPTWRWPTLDQGRESLDPNWTLERGADRRPRRRRDGRRRRRGTSSAT